MRTAKGLLATVGTVSRSAWNLWFFPGLAAGRHSASGRFDLAAALWSAVKQARQQSTALALDVNWRPTFWDEAADPSAGRQLPRSGDPAAAGAGGSDQVGPRGSFGCLPVMGVIQGSCPRRSTSSPTDTSAATDIAGRPAQAAFGLPWVDTTGAGDAFLQVAAPLVGGSAERICSPPPALGAPRSAIDPQPSKLKWMVYRIL